MRLLPTLTEAQSHQQLAERTAALRAAEEALEADRTARLTAGRPARQVFADNSGTLGGGLASQPNTFERTDHLVEALQIKAEALQNKVNMLEAKAASATKHQSMVQKEKNDMEAQLADLQRKSDLECAGRARLEEELKVAVQQVRVMTPANMRMSREGFVTHCFEGQGRSHRGS